MSISNLDATSISGSAKALVKGVALIDLVAASKNSLRQTDLIDESGLPRATATRLLDALCELYVLRVDRHGYYELGPRVAAWGQEYMNNLDIARLGMDLVEDLVKLSNETSFMGVRDGSNVLYVAAVNSPQAVRPSARVGSRNPLHSTGIGKALLAFAPEKERDSLLAGELVRRTENTITDREQLDRHLAEIRARGYSTDDIENEEGVRCVAAPVRDRHGDVVAAISVSAPAYRFGDPQIAEIAPHVLRAAGELSFRLGYQAQDDDAAASKRKEST